MTDFFNEEIVEQSGNQMLEEPAEKNTEDVDDVFSDVGIRLAQLGIDPNNARLFSKRHPNRNILNVKTNLPNKLFFQYVLDNCNTEERWSIIVG